MRINKGPSAAWKIMQIGIVVKDMEKAMNSLSVLGFGPFIPKILPPGSKATFRGSPSQFKVDVQRSMIGDVELELLHPVSGNSPHQEFLDTKGEGVQHILFEVLDIKKELDRLTRAGASILLNIEFQGGGIAYVDLNTCGFVIELIQLPKDNPEFMKIVLSLDY